MGLFSFYTLEKRRILFYNLEGMKTKYIFLDIDGTLFSSEISGTPKSAIEAIHEARKNGHKVFLCTGRTRCQCSDYFQYEIDGFIFGAGSCIYVGEECIFDQPVPTLDVKTLVEDAEALNLAYVQEGKDHCYCNQLGYDWSLSYFNKNNKPYDIKKAKLDSLHFIHDEKGYLKEPIYKLFFFAKDVDVFKKYEEGLKDPYKIAVTHAEIGGLCGAEVTNRGLTKSGGIIQILDYYGATQEDTIGIGDSMNDMDMVEFCDLGVAMGNALPELKEVADYITTDILEDGIYNAFKYSGVI